MMLRSRIFVILPLTPVATPELEAYFIELATYYFDTGLQVGDEFEIQSWGISMNRELEINATAGIVKRIINVIPGERTGEEQKIDVFQISLYAEIADKDELDKICQSFIKLNPGMYFEKQ